MTAKLSAEELERLEQLALNAGITEHSSVGIERATLIRLLNQVREAEALIAEAHKAGRRAVQVELTEAVDKFNDDDSKGIGQLIDVIAPWLLDDHEMPPPAQQEGSE